ncbi:hypothetical protein ES705_33619 [subsurface metagenome]
MEYIIRKITLREIFYLYWGLYKKDIIMHKIQKISIKWKEPG